MLSTTNTTLGLLAKLAYHMLGYCETSSLTVTLAKLPHAALKLALNASPVICSWSFFLLFASLHQEKEGNGALSVFIWIAAHN